MLNPKMSVLAVLLASAAASAYTRFIVHADQHICPGFRYECVMVDDTLCRTENISCGNIVYYPETVGCDDDMKIWLWPDGSTWEGRSGCYDDAIASLYAYNEDPTGCIQVVNTSVYGMCYGDCTTQCCAP